MRFKTRSDTPDLHTQLESLLDQVWRSESDWRLWDRVDAAVMLESRSGPGRAAGRVGPDDGGVPARNPSHRNGKRLAPGCGERSGDAFGPHSSCPVVAASVRCRSACCRR